MATGSPKIESGSSFDEYSKRTAQQLKKENKCILSLTQQDAPFQDPGANVTPRFTLIAPDMYL